MLDSGRMASILLGCFATVGCIVCLCAGFVAAARAVGWAVRANAGAIYELRHRKYLREAVSEWKARNPVKVAELARLEDAADG